MSAALRASVHQAPRYDVVVAPPWIDQAAQAVTTYRRLRGHGKELHVISLSRVLRDRIRTLMPFESRGDTVMTYLAYSKNVWQTVLRTTPQQADDYNVDLWEFRQRLRARFVRPLNRRHVVVLNGQQLPSDFYTVLRLLGIEATVFVDPVQVVGDSGTSLDELVTVLNMNGPTVLRDSETSTAQIHELLKCLDEAYLPSEAPHRDGPKPMLINHEDINEEILFVVDHARAHREARIGVLVPTQELVQVFKDGIGGLFDGTTQWHLSDSQVPRHAAVTAPDPGIKVLTWASAVSMRFDHAVLAALDQMANQAWFENAVRVLGPTGRDRLILSYSGVGRPTVLRSLPTELLDDHTQEPDDSEWVDVAPTTTPPAQPKVEAEPVPTDGDDPVHVARRLLTTRLRNSARAKHLLTAVQEVGLARLMRPAGADLAEELPRGFRSTVREHDERARAFDAMVLHNTGLVGACINRYLGAGLDRDDLHQHGVLGLMRAIEKWDASRGLKFSTYAINWINQAMSRAIADEGTTIRIPVHMYETVRKVRAVRNRLRVDHDDVSISQIAESAKLSPEQVVRCLRLALGVVSLDAPLGADGEISFAELVPVPFEHDSNPDYVVDRALGAELVRTAVSRLKEREAEVLRLRFGFDGGDDRTLDKIGEHFSFTRERARQIESKAKEKLVKKLAEVGLVADGAKSDPAPPKKRSVQKPTIVRRPPQKKPLGDELATGVRLAEQLGNTGENSTVTNLLIALADRALQSDAHQIRIRTAGSGATTRLAFVHDGIPFAANALHTTLASSGSWTHESAALGVAASLYDEVTGWNSHVSPECLVLTSAANTDSWWLNRASKTPPTGLVSENETASWSIVLCRAPRPQVARARMATILDRCIRELGVVFGGLLTSHISIDVNGRIVTEQDPFLWSNPAGQHLGEEHLATDGFSAVVSPRVLPHPEALRAGDTDSVGDPADWRATQGFYVRSGGRYLSYGGWLGLGDLDMAADTALARVLVDVPREQLDAWTEGRAEADTVPPEPLRSRLVALAQIARGKSELVMARHRAGETM